jgi:hypothetical protein
MRRMKVERVAKRKPRIRLEEIVLLGIVLGMPGVTGFLF